MAILMKYCTLDLYEWMKTNDEFKKDYNPKRVISVFVPFLVNAVEQMRFKNIVHFDLNPENILRCNYIWKVADFIWTRGYNDPEVLQQKHGGLVVAAPRTDLFFVGVILNTIVKRTKMVQSTSFQALEYFFNNCWKRNSHWKSFMITQNNSILLILSLLHPTWWKSVASVIALVR